VTGAERRGEEVKVEAVAFPVFPHRKRSEVAVMGGESMWYGRTALALTVALAGACWGAAPPARLTPEQVKLLRERPWFGVTEKTLDIELKVYGTRHLQVEKTAQRLANMHKVRGQWKEEVKYRRVVVEACQALRGDRYFRTVDARWELAEAQAQQKRSPAQRAALARARELSMQVVPLYRKGQAAKAAPLMKQALQIHKEALGEKHPLYATSLNNLAELYTSMGDPRAALPLFQKALQIQKEVLGEKHPLYAASLDNLAGLYQDVGDHKAALPLLQKALQIRRDVLGEKHPEYALSLNNLASLYRDMGDHKQALPLYKQVRKVLKEVLGEKHPFYAASLNGLALLYSEMGDHKAALPLFQKALQIRKEALGEKHPEYARSLSGLALLYKEIGEHKAALPLFKQALAIKKEVLGEKHPSYATTLNNLAALYQDMGDHKQALPLYQKALQIRKETLGENRLSYANSLNNLAALYQEIGDHKAALSLYKQALQITKDALGEKHLHYALGLNNLACLYQDMGDHKAALPLHKQALHIRKEALGEKHPQYALSLNNLASLYQEMGNHRAALPLFQKALSIRKKALGEKHPLYAATLNNLAALYQDMGDHKQALPTFKQALHIIREARGEKHPLYAATLNNLASLCQSMGDHKAALPLAEEATALTLAHLRDNAFVQSDRQQLDATIAVRFRLDVRLSLMDEGSYGHVLAWKGAVLLRQRQRRLFTSLSTDPKTRQATIELQATTRRLAALSASSRAARKQLEEMTLQQERLQAKLSGLSNEAKAVFGDQTLSPEALAKSLPERTALVDFLFYNRAGIVYRDGKPNGVRHLVAFVSRKGRARVRVDLGPANKVADALLLWRKALIAREDGQAEAEALHRRIWSPLERHLVGTKVVLVSPDGPLTGVPFCALPGKKKGSFLIEDVAVAIVPVPQALPEILKATDRKKRLGASLLLVGDVDYDNTGPAVKVAAGERGAPLGVRRDWGRLADTFAETAAVSKSFSALFEGGTVIDLGKGKATKAKVREALGKVRYAHLATHGFFAEESSKNAMNARSKPDAFFGREGVTGWHPLLLSGIVLAGANREPKEGEEDGILTALEVSEMELPKLELVVLSACETGLGKTAGGEGLLGLQRAFAVAGARTVVASLWQVDDRATRALMGDFYTAAWDTEKVVSRAEALRQAQLKMLKDGAARGGIVKLKPPRGKPTPRLPPYYWAGFVLSGDWR
jgi:tetratricopeptide (TPR) repeat protein